MANAERPTPNIQCRMPRGWQIVARPLRLPGSSKRARCFSAGKPGVPENYLSPGRDGRVLSSRNCGTRSNGGRDCPSAKALGSNQEKDGQKESAQPASALDGLRRGERRTSNVECRGSHCRRPLRLPRFSKIVQRFGAGNEESKVVPGV